MNSSLTSSTFTNVGEIGPRLKMVRQAAKFPVSRMVAKSGMHDCVILAVEKGASTPVSVQTYADSLGVTVSITATNSLGVETEVNLNDLQEYIKDTRHARGMTRNVLARKAGVQSSSVEVFENCDRPTLKSTMRYLSALEVNLVVQLQVNDTALELTLPDSATVTQTADVSPLALSLALAKTITDRRVELDMSKAETSRLAGVSQISVAHIETASGSLPAVSNVAKALGMNLMITMTDTSGNVMECAADAVPVFLDKLRETSGFTVSEMARRIGTTYRAVRIFPDGTRNPVAAIERYAAALGVTLGHRTEVITTNESLAS